MKLQNVVEWFESLYAILCHSLFFSWKNLTYLFINILFDYNNNFFLLNELIECFMFVKNSNVLYSK